MHIVMLSDLETQGGAATSASRLADALCNARHHVTRIVAQRDQQRHPWATIEMRPSLAGWAMRRILPADQWRKFSTWVRLKQLDTLLTELQPDVISVHNLHGGTLEGWSNELVRTCVDLAPTVWTLHDMWSFTGRCAYSYSCRKFLNGCDASCPTSDEYPKLRPDRIAGAWQQRQRLLQEYPQLVVVTPSQWLQYESQAGLWHDHRVEVIPYGLPLDIYQPIDRTSARSQLGLLVDGPVLIFAAAQLNERRKGGAYLIDALPQVAHRPLTIITIGQGQLVLNIDGIFVHSLGYIVDEAMKMLAYNAADIMIHPAPVDNLPNTVMESIACGTPVVAFPIGGIPEMVRADQTGWLAAQVSSESLADAVMSAINAVVNGRNLRESCRAFAKVKYDAEKQAENYADLFRSLMSSKSYD